MFFFLSLSVRCYSSGKSLGLTSFLDESHWPPPMYVSSPTLSEESNTYDSAMDRLPRRIQGRSGEFHDYGADEMEESQP